MVATVADATGQSSRVVSHKNTRTQSRERTEYNYTCSDERDHIITVQSSRSVRRYVGSVGRHRGVTGEGTPHTAGAVCRYPTRASHALSLTVTRLGCVERLG